ncbi:MAG: hypothetical protein AAGI69_15765 [Cyanobacteria bacterium P01_H01_bin.21]
MAGWIKFVVIGLMGVLSLCLALPAAASVESSSDVRSPIEPRDRHAPEIQIAPHLTNPAEIPLAETRPPSPRTWFSETFIAEPVPERSELEELEDMDTTAEQWLSSVKRFFNGR